MRLVTRLIQVAILCGLLVAIDALGVAQNRTAPLAVGEMAPDFALESHQGQKITLSEARQKSPVVLVFYRGYW